MWTEKKALFYKWSDKCALHFYLGKLIQIPLNTSVCVMRQNVKQFKKVWILGLDTVSTSQYNPNTNNPRKTCETFYMHKKSVIFADCTLCKTYMMPTICLGLLLFLFFLCRHRCGEFSLWSFAGMLQSIRFFSLSKLKSIQVTELRWTKNWTVD